MALVTDEAIKVLEKFISTVKDAGIRINRVVLFGSYATGKTWEWSDIDIAIVSPDFSGRSFYDRKILNRFILKVDTRIEPHPFKPEDFTEDDYFVKEIVEKGIELKV